MPVGWFRTEMRSYSLPDCFSTTWVMPVGWFRTEMRSYSLSTGVGTMVWRAQILDSCSNSFLSEAGMPEQEPDGSMKERAAKRGLMTHMRGVVRSAVGVGTMVW